MIRFLPVMRHRKQKSYARFLEPDFLKSKPLILTTAKPGEDMIGLNDGWKNPPWGSNLNGPQDSILALRLEK